MLLKIGFRILDLIVLKFWNMKSKLNRHLSIKDFLIFQVHILTTISTYERSQRELYDYFRIVSIVVSCVID